jgi:hypothetical protein
MSLQTKAIKVEFIDEVTNTAYHAHIFHNGEIKVFDQDMKEFHPESILGQIIIEATMMTLMPPLPDADLSVIGLN